MTHRFKQAVVLLMALLMLIYGCGFKTEVLANTETENSPAVTEQSSQTDPASTGETEDTKKKSPDLDAGEQAILDANGITATEDTGKRDASGNYILGETSTGGTVSCSTSLRTLASRSFGDEPYNKKFQRAAGWDDGVIYSSDFARPDGTDIITT
ncbi:MAG: hypothetical protein ACLS76_17665, partial [Eubacterium callanderi]